MDTELPDDEFLARFTACSLPPEAFTHLGHVRLSWLQLQRLQLREAIDAVCGILAFATHLGAPEKYNRTMTEALLVLMAHGGATDRTLPWPAFLEANPDLITNARALLARYYSDERLTSARARVAFVTPDRESLPVGARAAPSPCRGNHDRRTGSGARQAGGGAET